MAGLTRYKAFINNCYNKPIPWDCLFELTFRCNLSCQHCFIIRKKTKELSKLEVFDILRQLKDMRCLNLILSGGEILTRKDFFAIAAYARKLNFNLILYTNGTLIDAKAADLIRDLNVLRVEISLYGFKRTHDKITACPGSFDRTVKGIRLLVDRKIKVYVKEVLMSQNIGQIWELQKFVIDDLGVKWRSLGGLLIAPCDDGDKRPLKYRPSDAQIKVYMEEVIRQHKKQGASMDWSAGNKSGRLCEAGFHKCNISPYGELHPCTQLRLNKDNSLRQRSLRQIWLGHPQIKELRKMTMADRVDCRECKWINYCMFCPGVAFLEQGSLLRKLPEACRAAEMLYRAAQRAN